MVLRNPLEPRCCAARGVLRKPYASFSAAAAEKAAAPDVHEMADCMGHQDASGQKKGETGPSAKDSDKKCLDCTHCCLSHVMVIPSFSVDQPQLASFLHSLQGQSPFDDVLFSFLRPPQSLV